MSPTEILTELTDSELDVVCGGIFNLGNIIIPFHFGKNDVVQINTAVQIGLAIGGGAIVAQFINQSNVLQSTGT
jgi:hypothetical protein